VRKGVANRWRSEQDPGDGIYPRTEAAHCRLPHFTSRQVFKATYLAVKNITLVYTLLLRRTNILKLQGLFERANGLYFHQIPGP